MPSPSEEKYLEEIYYAVLENGYARISLVAKSLKVGVSSVSKMAGRLAQEGFIDYKPYGIIALTQKGMKKGRELERNHKVLEEFFRMVELEETLIEQEVMNIAHHLSNEALKKIEIHVKEKRTNS
ncbi:transcriptional regulator MntR [Rossellomorea vietnamensis]|uniref:Manganese transport regulator n=2 Tax=Rossellomorea TaxID=2837508 RepID=A0A5D4K833_9BACI|nr:MULTISPECIES: iron dependent repressor, metal binding and dimerization domain protein [Rossellomorea]TYR73521.1 transcriptional regulator MntR [Rossellomorea vietnamensis]TYS82927.1 transcriptional regulator MntR [Rossellomorea aquimaris]